MSIQDRTEFLTTSVSGNDGNAAARLGVSSRLDYILSNRLDFVHNGCLRSGDGLDLIQARDDAAVKDVSGFGPYLQQDRRVRGRRPRSSQKRSSPRRSA